MLLLDFVIELSYTVPGILGESVAWLHTYRAQFLSPGALIQALRLAPSGQLRRVRDVILATSTEPNPPEPSSDASSKTSPLAIALAAGIGGAALVLAIIALVLLVRKKGPRAGYTAVQ